MSHSHFYSSTFYPAKEDTCVHSVCYMFYVYRLTPKTIRRRRMNECLSHAKHSSLSDLASSRSFTRKERERGIFQLLLLFLRRRAQQERRERNLKHWSNQIRKEQNLLLRPPSPADPLGGWFCACFLAFLVANVLHARFFASL